MCTNHFKIKYCFTDYNIHFGPQYYYWDLFFLHVRFFVLYPSSLFTTPWYTITATFRFNPLVFDPPTDYFTYTCFYRRLYLDITCLFHSTHTQTRERANQINIYLIARRLTAVEYYNYIPLCDNPDDARRDENAIIWIPSDQYTHDGLWQMSRRELRRRQRHVFNS